MYMPEITCDVGIVYWIERAESAPSIKTRNTRRQRRRIKVGLSEQIVAERIR
jgi:hypothetical protein